MSTQNYKFCRLYFIFFLFSLFLENLEIATQFNDIVKPFLLFLLLLQIEVDRSNKLLSNIYLLNSKHVWTYLPHKFYRFPSFSPIISPRLLRCEKTTINMKMLFHAKKEAEKSPMPQIALDSLNKINGHGIAGGKIPHMGIFSLVICCFWLWFDLAGSSETIS